MSLGLVLVLEPVWTVGALVLLLGFVGTGNLCQHYLPGERIHVCVYLRASLESNFLGFFGQHSHIKKPCILAAMLPRLLSSSSPGFRADMRPERPESLRVMGVTSTGVLCCCCCTPCQLSDDRRDVSSTVRTPAATYTPWEPKDGGSDVTGAYRALNPPGDGACEGHTGVLVPSSS